MPQWSLAERQWPLPLGVRTSVRLASGFESPERVEASALAPSGLLCVDGRATSGPATPPVSCCVTRLRACSGPCPEQTPVARLLPPHERSRVWLPTLLLVGRLRGRLRLPDPVTFASLGLFGAVPRTGAGRPTCCRLLGRGGFGFRLPTSDFRPPTSDSPPTTHYPPLITHHSLPTTHYPPPTTCRRHTPPGTLLAHGYSPD